MLLAQGQMRAARVDPLIGEVAKLMSRGRRQFQRAFHLTGDDANRVR